MAQKQGPPEKVHIRIRYEPLEKFVAHRAGHKAPRGETGKAWRFTECLKETVPLIYALSVQELRLPESERDPRIRHLIRLWQRWSRRNKRPQAIELTALAIQRAYRRVWEVYGITKPLPKPSHRPAPLVGGISKGPLGSFYRRYVQGHRGAVSAYRRILQVPRPWPPRYRGYWAYEILERPGSATGRHALLTEEYSTVGILSFDPPTD